MRHSFRIYLKPPLTDGRCPIRFRVSWNGRRVERTLDNTIPPDQWDTATNTPRRTARALNAEINALTADVDRAFDNARLEHRTPSEAEIRTAMGIYASIQQPDDPTFADTLLSFASDTLLSGAWSANTRRNYLHLCRIVRAWNPSVTLSQFDTAAFSAFLDHCFATGHINATVMKFAKQIRWALRTAAERHLCPPSPAAQFRPRYRAQSDNEVVFLSVDELLRVASLDLSSAPHLDSARDLFLFCCYTGLRYSDAAKLLKTDVHTDHIRIVTKKTADPLTIELNDTARAILDRYASTPGPLALPVISNQRLNDYIKDIARLAHIDTPVSRVWWVRSQRHEKSVPKWQVLTSHSGRRTFVVTALTLGIPSEVVMKWTGHKDHATMRPYVAIVDDLRRRSMDKFNTLPVSSPLSRPESPQTAPTSPGEKTG